MNDGAFIPTRECSGVVAYLRTHRFFCRQKQKPRRGLHAWVPPLFALLCFASDGAAWPLSLVPPFSRLALFPAYTHMCVVVLLLLSWALISSSLRGVAWHVRSIAGAVPMPVSCRGHTHGAARTGPHAAAHGCAWQWCTCVPSELVLRACLARLCSLAVASCRRRRGASHRAGVWGAGIVPRGLSARVKTLVVRLTSPDRCVAVGVCDRTHAVATGVTTRQETHA